MKSLIFRHPVTAYYIVAFIGAILMGLTGMFLFPSLSNYAFMLPQWAPALAAFVILSVTIGKSRICSLIQKAFFKKANLNWYIIALIIPIITCGISYTIFSFIEYKQLVKPILSRPAYNYVLCFLFTILGCFGEEIGWRGFMLPQLQKRYSLLISSLIVGFCWGFWHLSFHLGVLGFSLYILMTIEFSLIISWLCNKSKGNILPAVILHSTINICSLILFENVITDPLNKHLQIVLYGIYIVIFLIPSLFVVKDMMQTKVQ